MRSSRSRKPTPRTTRTRLATSTTASSTTAPPRSYGPFALNPLKRYARRGETTHSSSLSWDRSTTKSAAGRKGRHLIAADFCLSKGVMQRVEDCVIIRDAFVGLLDETMDVKYLASMYQCEECFAVIAEPNPSHMSPSSFQFTSQRIYFNITL